MWMDAYHEREIRMRRSLLGAQADDIEITVAEQGARRFASRGMQKLLVVVLKLAQSELMHPATILLDDLMADFDEERLALMLKIVQHTQGQIIITTPRTPDGAVKELIAQYSGLTLKL